MNAQAVGIPAALSYIQDLLGGPVDIETGTFALTTASAELMKRSYERVALVLCNVGGDDCHISVGPPPAANEGIYLASGGGIVTMDVRNDLILPSQNWYGQAASTTTTLWYALIYRYMDMHLG